MGLDNPIHIAFLLILLLLVFGAKRLPEMGKSLGSGMRGFKDALSGESEEHPAVAPVVASPQDLAVVAQPQTTLQPQAVPVAQSVASAAQPTREKLPV